jgi:hypothetical protein
VGMTRDPGLRLYMHRRNHGTDIEMVILQDTFDGETSGMAEKRWIKKLKDSGIVNASGLGKSSDPEWGKFTIMLKKETQKRASRLAEDMNPPRDLSDVAQDLLARWIEEQARRT